MSDTQTREAAPFGRLWASFSHLLPLASAISIFLSIWQLKGFLGHFGLQLVGLVSLNDAALQFFVIVSWFLPLLVAAAVYLLMSREQRRIATAAAFLGVLVVTAVASFAGSELSALFGAAPFHLAGPLASALVSLLATCGSIMALAFGLAWLGERATIWTRSQRLARAVIGGSQVLAAPLLILALVVASTKVGEIRAVSQEIRFFVWPVEGQTGPVRYRTQLTAPPPELAGLAETR